MGVEGGDNFQPGTHQVMRGRLPKRLPTADNLQMRTQFFVIVHHRDAHTAWKYKARIVAQDFLEGVADQDIL
jgi:hypothetical protein